MKMTRHFRDGLEGGEGRKSGTYPSFGSFTQIDKSDTKSTLYQTLMVLDTCAWRNVGDPIATRIAIDRKNNCVFSIF
jgi:hypothetical protein